jgi:hypothetical protein
MIVKVTTRALLQKTPNLLLSWAKASLSTVERNQLETFSSKTIVFQLEGLSLTIPNWIQEADAR